jgi:hypothetical protein
MVNPRCGETWYHACFGSKSRRSNRTSRTKHTSVAKLERRGSTKSVIAGSSPAGSAHSSVNRLVVAGHSYQQGRKEVDDGHYFREFPPKETLHWDVF